MLSCKDISKLASEHVDRNLPFFKRLQFRLHLGMCRNCRQFMDQFQLTVDSISKLKPVQTDINTLDSQVNHLVSLARTIKEQHS